MSGYIEFLARGLQFEDLVKQIKNRIAPTDYGWYPYNSLTVLPLLSRLFAPVYEEVSERWGNGPVADIGCGDGDLGALFAHFGSSVDAVDHRETNFNQMRGVALLAKELALAGRLASFDIDLDTRFELPRRHYAFAFFLGTLYHLKNPFYVLEQLAASVDWCVLSTRIASVTPEKVSMESEALAYLLGPREANNDPTNYWIFSSTGLQRLLDRTGWIVVNQERAGCQGKVSEPADPAADERIFVLLKSKRLHPEFYVRPLDGIYPVEESGWRWTAKQFHLEVTVARDLPPSEFALRFVVPAAVLQAGAPVMVTCSIGGHPAGSLSIEEADEFEFRGKFPPAFNSPLRLDFSVESQFQSENDRRELGVILPGEGGIPFRIS